jgi:hypothetical protein
LFITLGLLDISIGYVGKEAVESRIAIAIGLQDLRLGLRRVQSIEMPRLLVRLDVEKLKQARTTPPNRFDNAFGGKNSLLQDVDRKDW